MLILAVLTRYLTVENVIANGIGFAVSTQVNFVLSSFFIWGDRKQSLGRSVPPTRAAKLLAHAGRWRSFNTVAVVALIVNEIAFTTATHIGVWLFAAAFIGTVTGSTVTFTLNHYLTFRKSEQERYPELTQIVGRAQELGIALFLPAYNEAVNLQILIPRIFGYLRSLTCPFTIIIVNDGSKDETGAVADFFEAQYSGHVIAVHHSPNQGYGGALITGIKTALERTRHGLIAFCDSDNQFKIESLGTLIAALQNNAADAAVGYRIARANSVKRIVMGRAWHWLSTQVLGYEPASDVDCGFKLFSRALLEKIAPQLKGEYAAVSPEILTRAAAAGFVITEAGVTHLARLHGRQTGSDLKVVIRSLINLFVLQLSLQLEKDGMLPPELIARAAATGFVITDTSVINDTKPSLRLVLNLFRLRMAVRKETHGGLSRLAPAQADYSQ